MGIQTVNHTLPFNPCISCVQRSRCPLMMPGVRSNLMVRDNTKCALRQLPPQQVANLATQLEAQLGILEVDKEILGTRLEFTLSILADLEGKVIRG